MKESLAPVAVLELHHTAHTVWNESPVDGICHYHVAFGGYPADVAIDDNIDALPIPDYSCRSLEQPGEHLVDRGAAISLFSHLGADQHRIFGKLVHNAQVAIEKQAPKSAQYVIDVFIIGHRGPRSQAERRVRWNSSYAILKRAAPITAPPTM